MMPQCVKFKTKGENFMRRFLSLVLAFLMVLSTIVVGIVPITAASETEDDGSSAGTGSAGMTYAPTPIPEGAQAITSAEEFAAMASDGVYYLANDISISAMYGSFSGELYGNGKTITLNGLPAFSKLIGAKVYDLTLKGEVNCQRAASIAQIAQNDAYLYRIVNEATLTGQDRAAGIVFNVITGTVEGCLNKGSVTATDEGGVAGGIVSMVTGTTVIKNCINTGAITSVGDAGGIIGFDRADSANVDLTVDTCVSSGTVQGTNTAAGIVAKMEPKSTSTSFNSITVKNSTNSGTVTVTDTAGVAAGLIGTVSNAASVVIENTKSTGNVTAVSNASGGIATLSGVTSVVFKNCFTDGTIKTTATTGETIYTSGLLGISASQRLSITDCISNAYLSAASGFIGGLLARASITDASVLTEFKNCYVFGTIRSANKNGKSASGGVFCRIDMSADCDIKISECGFFGDQLRITGSNCDNGYFGAGIVEKIVASSAVVTVDSCSVVSYLEFQSCCGGIVGSLSVTNGETHITNNFFSGFMLSDKGNREIGGVVGASNGSSANELRNNAVYAEIKHNTGATISTGANLGYCNSVTSNSIKDSIFVGTFTGAQIPVLAHASGSKSDFTSPVNNRLADRLYYFVSGGTSLVNLFYSRENGKVSQPLVDGLSIPMASATADVSDALNTANGATVWTHVTGYALPSERYPSLTGNIPVSAKATIEKATAALAATSTAVTEIGTKEAFLTMTPGGNYKLTKDLVLDASVALPFIGTLDGAGHSITVTGAPVFWSLSNATVKNLRIKNAVINNDLAAVGALAPEASNVVLDNVSSTASVSAKNVAGGLIGKLMGSDVRISNCVVSGSVSSSSTDAGGIAGRIDKVTNASLTNCTFSGSLTATSSSNTTGKGGGMIGVIDSTTNVAFDQCYVTGSFSVDHNFGGIVGEVTKLTNNGSFTITNSVYTGKQLKAAGEHTGGMIGYLKPVDKNLTFKVDSCVVISDIHTSLRAGGIACTLQGVSSSNVGYAVSNCLVIGTIKSDGSNNNTGGLVGYCYNGTPGYLLSNNAVYIDIIAEKNTATASAFGGYGNLGSAGYIKNNLFVGSIVTGTDGEVILATSRNNNPIPLASVTGNYFYRTGGKAFEYLWYGSDTNNALIGSETTELSYATENVAASLGAANWVYVEDHLINGKPFTGTIPASAKNVLQAAGLITASPIAIDSAEDFLAMEADGFYKLTADITLSASYAETFTGTLDGNGYTITVNGAPAFKKLSGAYIFDLSLEGTVTDTVAESSIGALAAEAAGITLDGIHADVTVSGTKNVGGLIGNNDGDVVIRNSSVTGSVTASAGYAGGFIGNSTNASVAQVDVAVFSGSVSSSGQAGGIFGRLYTANCPNAVLRSCVVKAKVSGDGHVGGIAGYVCSNVGTGATLSVDSCVYVGALVSKEKAGGIIGQVNGATGALWDDVSFTSNVASGTINSAHYAGGIVGDVRGWNVSATFDSNLVFLEKWVSTYTGDSPQYVGGLWGYGRDHRDMKVTNNALYFNLESRGHSFQAIGGHANGNAAGTIYSNNLFAGSAVLNTTNKYTAEQIVKTLYQRGSGTPVKADKLKVNYYFFENDTFDGATSKNATGAYVKLDPARDIAMSSATENVSEALGTDWTYVSALRIGKLVFTGNIPQSALAALDASTDAVDQPVEIDTAEKFLNMLPGGNYKLTANITLNSSYALPFVGTLDGNGKTITVNGAPVFSYISAGHVKNLTIDGKVTAFDSDSAGALASEAAFIRLDGVKSNATVSATNTAGGIVGTVYGACSFLNCENSGSVSGRYAGGIVGHVKNTYTANTFAGCKNSGLIISIATDGHAGGIMGVLSDKKLAGVRHLITDCINTGNVFATNCSGGILALARDLVRIEKSINTGVITGMASAGGIVDSLTSQGNSTNGAHVYYCVNKGDVVSDGAAAGIARNIGSANANRLVGCVSIGNVTSTNKAANTLASYIYGDSNIQWNTTAGKITAGPSSQASLMLNYNNASGSNFEHNLFLQNPGDLVGSRILLMCDRNGSNCFTNGVLRSDKCYNFVREGVVDYFDWVRPDGNVMPEDYAYYYTDADLANEAAVQAKFGAEFVVVDGIPVYKEVASVYAIAAGIAPAAPIEIDTAEEFLAMTPGSYYKLTADIELNASYNAYPFIGILDGNNKTITVNGAPVFADFSVGAVKDLTIEGSVTDNTSAYVGAIAPEASIIDLENVTVDVNVTATGAAGGFLGSISGYAIINNSTNKGSVTTNGLAGGILAYAYSTAKNIVITNVHNAGSIKSTTASAGGILGAVGNQTSDSFEPMTQHVFENCSNSGNVYGADRVGGILGVTFDSASFSFCSNSGKIEGDMGVRLYVGGIVGTVYVEGFFYRCDNSGEIYGNAMTGGIAGSVGHTAYLGPNGGQRFIGCTHTGKVIVTFNNEVSSDIARVPGGIVGYTRADIPYRSIVINYCSVTGDIILNAGSGNKGKNAGVLCGYVDSLTYTEFKYNYFTGSIKANGEAIATYLPYDNNTFVSDKNEEANYSVEVAGLCYIFDQNGITELPAEYIIKTHNADGTLNYEKLCEMLNDNFDGEVFIMQGGIPVLDSEYDFSKDVSGDLKPIESAEDFLNMDPYGNYFLAADIVLNETYGYVFSGILDGVGHTITTSVPLFEAVEDAYFTNLTIDGVINVDKNSVGALTNEAVDITLVNVTNNADILNTATVTADSDYSKVTGGLIGIAVGTVTLTGCRNNGVITASIPGGLVGYASNATFTATDCVNAGMLTNYSTKCASAGGILAYGENGTYLITECYNTGDILFASTATYGNQAGGMIGTIVADSASLVIKDCANSGVIISATRTGGIVGITIGLTSSEFVNCKNAGKILCTGDFAGGIAAWVSNSTTTSALNANGNKSVTHSFENCTNIGEVYAGGRFAAGILAVTLDNSNFNYCLNTGNITTGRGNWDYSHATGIATWSGGQTNFYYCVNTGDITGAANAAGIGGYIGNVINVSVHNVIGCVNTGNILSVYTSNDGGRSQAVGLVRRSGSSGMKINGCVVDGTVRSVNGNAFALFFYANEGSNDISGNIVLLKPGDISGATTYLAGSTAASIELNVAKTNALYAHKDVFDRFATTIDMPADYSFYFEDSEITDGSIIEKLGANFVMEDGIPMHKDVVEVYRQRRVTSEDFIPEDALPEVDEETTTPPEDSDTSEPESSETTTPEGPDSSDTSDSDSSDTSDPTGSETVDQPGSDGTTESGDVTTDPDDSTTSKDETTTGGKDDEDDKKSGCGSVVSATLALAAIALIAPAMVIIKKKDEE